MADRSDFLGSAQTKDYKPTLLRRGVSSHDLDGLFAYTDVNDMRWDPQVSFGLRILFSPLPRVKAKAVGDRPVADYAYAQFRRFWTRSLPAAFLNVVYGNCAGEVLYDEGGDGRLRYDRLKDLHPLDCAPLVGQESGSLCGIAVKGGANVRLRPPRSLWLANEPQFGSMYGVTRLREAWKPWKEKTGRHGALDVRRHWFIKNAFRGAMMRHPGGSVEIADGVFVSCQDYARELVEKFEAGGVVTLPVARDSEGNYLWEWTDPVSLGELKGVAEWLSSLDREILVALGIPPEVVDAAESGSGWSGRSVPFLVWLQGIDQVAQSILQGFKDQVLDLMIEAEFGIEAANSYAIELESLVPEGVEQAAGQQGQPAGQGGAMGQQGQPAPTPPQPVRMSQDANPWQSYTGPRGGTGWKRSDTGKVRYGGSRPGADDAGEDEAGGESKPAAAPKQKSAAREEYEAEKAAHAERQASREKVRAAIGKAAEAVGATKESFDALDLRLNAAVPSSPDASEAPAALAAHAAYADGLAESSTAALESVRSAMASVKDAGDLMTDNDLANGIDDVEKAKGKLDRAIGKHRARLESAGKAQARADAAHPGEEPQEPVEEEVPEPPELVAARAAIEALDADDSVQGDDPGYVAALAELNRHEAAHEEAVEQAEAAHEKATEAHEKAHARWDRDDDRWRELEEKAGDAWTAAEDAASDASDAASKFSDALTDAQEWTEGFAGLVDQEESEDEEPEEPEEPEEEDDDEADRLSQGGGGTFRPPSRSGVVRLAAPAKGPPRPGLVWKEETHRWVKAAQAPPAAKAQPSPKPAAAPKAAPKPKAQKHSPEALAARVGSLSPAATPGEREALVADLVSSLTAAQIDAMLRQRGGKGGKAKAEKAERLVAAALEAAAPLTGPGTAVTLQSSAVAAQGGAATKPAPDAPKASQAAPADPGTEADEDDATRAARAATQPAWTAKAYETLGIPAGSSLRDVKRAWVRHTMQHHPDRGGDDAVFRAGTEAMNRLKRHFAGELDDGKGEGQERTKAGEGAVPKAPSMNINPKASYLKMEDEAALGSWIQGMGLHSEGSADPAKAAQRQAEFDKVPWKDISGTALGAIVKRYVPEAWNVRGTQSRAALLKIIRDKALGKPPGKAKAAPKAEPAPEPEKPKARPKPKKGGK